MRHRKFVSCSNNLSSRNCFRFGFARRGCRFSASLSRRARVPFRDESTTLYPSKIWTNVVADGNFHIFSVDVNGTGIVQLTEGPYDVHSAMYSPDGHSILYKRLPVDSGAPSELVISWVARQIEELPSTSISMLLTGDLPTNTINATITFGFYSIGPRVGIGFHQEFLNISTDPGYSRAVGLGYDEMREYSYFSTIHGNVYDNRLIPIVVNQRQYAAWTESQWFGTYTGFISEQNITEATLCTVSIEFENLTVYFEDESTFVCSSQLITLATTFTRTGEIWDTDVSIETSEEEGIYIDNNVVTISIRFPVYVSPFLFITTMSILAAGAVIVGALYLKFIRNKPEYHDEYVTYY